MSDQKDPNLGETDEVDEVERLLRRSTLRATISVKEMCELAPPATYPSVHDFNPPPATTATTSAAASTAASTAANLLENQNKPLNDDSFVAKPQQQNQEIPTDNWPLAVEMIGWVLNPWQPTFPFAFSVIRSATRTQSKSKIQNEKSDDDDKSDGGDVVWSVEILQAANQQQLERKEGVRLGIVFVAEGDGLIPGAPTNCRRFLHGPTVHREFTTIQELDTLVRTEANHLLQNINNAATSPSPSPTPSIPPINK
jgi:hypothetical protein